VNADVILNTREQAPCYRAVLVTRAIIGVLQVENNYDVINNGA